MSQQEIKKTVLVTGADGFIGSHLVEKLFEEGFSVRAMNMYNSIGSTGWLSNLPEKTLNSVEVVSGDIRDAWFVDSCLEGIDTVYHLAALIAIPYSYLAPSSYLETNVNGTLNILQAAKRNGTRRVLITSTSEVYGTANYTPIDEKHIRQAQSPYSASKIASDSLADSFFRSFDLPTTIVRPFNTYGPRQSARAFIPTVISQLLVGKENLMLGSLSPTRDLNFVQDTTSGFIEIAKTEGTIGLEVNIASGVEHSMRDIAETLIQLINPSAKIIEDQTRIRPEKSEVLQLLGDNSLLKRLTNWTQKYSLEAGLLETIDWFRKPENLKHYNPDKYII